MQILKRKKPTLKVFWKYQDLWLSCYVEKIQVEQSMNIKSCCLTSTNLIHSAKGVRKVVLCMLREQFGSLIKLWNWSTRLGYLRTTSADLVCFSGTRAPVGMESYQSAYWLQNNMIVKKCDAKIQVEDLKWL